MLTQTKRHLAYLLVGMIIIVVTTLVAYAVLSSGTETEFIEKDVYTREDWGAAPPRKPVNFTDKPYIIIIKHTGGAVCRNFEECARRIRQIQKEDMEKHNLSDIRYNFLVGLHHYRWIIFEGRGWTTTNEEWKQSIDVAYIGNFSEIEPVANASNPINKLRMAFNDHYDNYEQFFEVPECLYKNTTDSPGHYLYKIINKEIHDVCTKLDKDDQNQITCESYNDN